MPERKSHVKSRLGCIQCKLRRVKCDEARPTCGNCKRRQEACSYQTRSRPFATPSPDTNGLDHQQQTNGTTHHTHIRQLELMHQYSTSTWETITINPKVLETHGTDAYQIEVPRLALSHDFLLDTVFAITSLHLAYLRPAEARTYIADATRYHTSALAACRESLMNIDASGCRAMYYTSAKLGMISLAFRAVDPEYTMAHKPTETIAQLAALWHGTASIINASKDLMDEETHNIFFPRLDWDQRNGSVLGAHTHAFLAQLREKARAMPSPPPPLPPQQQQEQSPEIADETASEIDPRAIYLEAIDQLQLLLDAYELEFSRVLAWVVAVPPPFINFMLQGQPLARAIVLLYSVVFRNMDDRWWARNFRRSVVDELAAAVAAAEPDLMEMVNFVEGWTKPAEEFVPMVPAHEHDVASLASWVDGKVGLE